MDSASTGTTRIERILAYMVAGVVGVSIACFIAVLVGSWAGQAAAQSNGDGIWWFVIMFPYFGLPLGMLLVIVLVVSSAVRRNRENRQRA